MEAFVTFLFFFLLLNVVYIWYRGEPPIWPIYGDISRTGKWLPKEGRYEKLKKGQWTPTTFWCHKYIPFSTFWGPHYPLWALSAYRCEICGLEKPNSEYNRRKAKKFWDDFFKDLKKKEAKEKRK